MLPTSSSSSGAVGAVAEDERLHRELDVDHAAGAVLDVEAAGPDRMRGAHLLAHRPHFVEQRLQVARRGEHGAAHRLEARRQPLDAGAPARARQRLVLPGPRRVAAAAGLVVLERRHRRDQQAGVAVRPERRVDVEQLAGGGAHRQPGDELADEGAVDLGRLVGLGLGIVVDEDDVEVAAVAELLAAELAVGDDRQLRLRPMRRLQVLPGPARWRSRASRRRAPRGRRRPARR